MILHSTSEVTTLWSYTNLFIIIIIEAQLGSFGAFMTERQTDRHREDW